MRLFLLDTLTSQSCQKVPVQSTKQVCQRVCTQTYTQQINSGKGMPITSFGKGRRLLGVIGSLLSGKGMVAGKGGQLVDSNCNDVRTKSSNDQGLNYSSSST